jgi:Na+/proline symporter
LYSGALFIKEAIDLNLYVSVIILLVIAAVFTIGGGLTAVIWTDFIQTIVMLIGAFYLLIASKLGFTSI